MKEKLFRVISFLLIMAILLSMFTRLFSIKYKDGTLFMEKYYELPEDSLDVLGLGTSHTYCAINPAVLWDEKGIAAYNLCCAAQPIWNSYHYLVEALKTQRPKLIILDTYFLYFRKDYQDAATSVKSTYGMKWSKNRIEAIKASVPEDQKFDFLLDYCRYHSRYSNLSSLDVFTIAKQPSLLDFKGFSFTPGVKKPDKLSKLSNYNIIGAMSEKTEKYYRLIIETAIENKIPLLVAKLPFVEVQALREINNGAKEIAEEYNSELVKFVNFNDYREEIGLDENKDYRDLNHLSISGSSKFSKYLSEYLDKNYDLPNHHNDEKYDTWVRNSVVNSMLYRNQALKNISSLKEYFTFLINNKDAYNIVINVSGWEKVDEREWALNFSKKVMKEYSLNNDKDCLSELEQSFADKGIDIAKKINGFASYAEQLKLLGFDMSQGFTNGAYALVDGRAETFVEDKDFFESYSFSRLDDLAVKSYTYNNDEDEKCRAYATLFNGSQTSKNEHLSIFVYDKNLLEKVDSICVEFIDGKIVR